MRRLFVALSAIAVLLVPSRVTLGQVAPPPAGHWEGAIEVPGQPLKVEVDLARKGDKWEGTVAIPVQGMKGFPLSAITVAGDTVSFAMNGVPGTPTFKGTISKDGKSLSGQYTQGPGTLPFSLTRTGEAKFEPPPAKTPITKEIEGSWEGALDVNGTTLRLVLKLANGPDGKGTGTLVSVDQNGAEVPVTAVVQNGSHLIVQTVVGSYEGDLKDGQLTGTWTQGPGTLPLVFKRAK